MRWLECILLEAVYDAESKIDNTFFPISGQRNSLLGDEQLCDGTGEQISEPEQVDHSMLTFSTIYDDRWSPSMEASSQRECSMLRRDGTWEVLTHDLYFSQCGLGQIKKNMVTMREQYYNTFVSAFRLSAR